MATIKRGYVYIQILHQGKGRWKNEFKCNTVEEATKRMRELQQEFPKAVWRIKDDNLVTHTY